ncbi:thymidylate synthase [Candidatus Roizmanbacteria bacterium RIFCSPHIGHO2_02_FULL_37_15]|uniref:Thymidylate synthase n=1 Tax=Candidatus Roizmanbacteria bacterium RIFCSPLOWO2_01_FULL_37_16 TaxID=1802058 RepID=A0A1F7IM90_9BACT|nr:MAG: thymidylate synthase [Candidatus Roizmanbacteria bacterium RIFCSPHIGHO2_01_FULL_37_16b]OGK22321.1 MAG: thymidylate synthase [Candidatus Roizmanbacteria bacterium RIFCSPHIGHO2_02_FULL_37_15]OGK34201.1 MAG: thymidylate synthase [Candidatus Roizmanbacteria bacterium RIFCSPHIGHO2_12_FULL_36_11]OGK44488.1 MAG: thymidylate synthase [Candidatus Roizmanbacteria bacterium RIFCSPLOWO2_01_FULL_37_16]OGK55936.1 MAG: thymidylate synthase [Candidatus Roizmanbacteria bacterium RIFCSPLOWO2_02_FULL_37_9
MRKIHPEKQYLDLLEEALTKGYRKVDRGTGDASYSLFGKQMRFDLAEGFPLLTTKKVYWKGVTHELYWFMSGQSNIKYLVDNNVHIWDDYPYKIYRIQNSESRIKNLLSKEEFIEKIKTDNRFAKKWGELPRIYGELWRHWPTRNKRTIDQLKWAINEVIEDPAAHNAIVNSWNPEYLYTMAKYEETSHFPICHNMYQLNVIDGRLCLQLYQRSADLFLGVPFNIASYALLTLIIAKLTGYKPGDFVHTFGDVHIYEIHIDQVKEQLKRKPRPFPQVKFIKDFKNIDEFKPEYLELVNYNPHPPIKAALSVSGGYFKSSK